MEVLSGDVTQKDRTTLDCTVEVRDALREYVHEERFRSYDMALRHLLCQSGADVPLEA